jgi:DNA mismatch endonuclease (patch repair protein)
MAEIRASGNKSTELRLINILRQNHITGWRRKQNLPGKPDFVFRREKLAVFVDGCFWHGCRWHCRMPKSHQSYWQPKIEKNKARDKAVRRELGQKGWGVLRIWEHELKNSQRVTDKIMSALAQHNEKSD